MQGNETSYFAFRRSSVSVPGIHFFIGLYGDINKPPEPRKFGRASMQANFETYVKQKQDEGKKYAAVFAQSNTVFNLLK